MAWLDSGARQSRTQFAIEETADGWKGRRTTFLKGVSVEHVARLEPYQPYCGCRWTAWLRKISNRDKHEQWLITPIKISGEVLWKKGPPGSFSRETRGQVRRAVLADGREIDVYMDGDLTGHVTLAEGPPVIELLEHLKTGVAGVLDHFLPDFSAATNPPPAI